MHSVMEHPNRIECWRFTDPYLRINITSDFSFYAVTLLRFIPWWCHAGLLCKSHPVHDGESSPSSVPPVRYDTPEAVTQWIIEVTSFSLSPQKLLQDDNTTQNKKQTNSFFRNVLKTGHHNKNAFSHCTLEWLRQKIKPFTSEPSFYSHLPVAMDIPLPHVSSKPCMEALPFSQYITCVILLPVVSVCYRWLILYT